MAAAEGEDTVRVPARGEATRVAQEQTDLVCGLNLEYVDGVREGLGCAGVETSLDPVPGGCCVTARASDTGPDEQP